VQRTVRRDRCQVIRAVQNSARSRRVRDRSNTRQYEQVTAYRINTRANRSAENPARDRPNAPRQVPLVLVRFRDEAVAVLDLERFCGSHRRFAGCSSQNTMRASPAIRSTEPGFMGA
jgi:hypothetical protein